MSNIFKSMKLDYHVLKGNYKIFLSLAYVVGIVIGLLSKATYMTGMIIMLISAVSSSTFFSVYEKNNLSKLYGMLPLKRSQAIIGRYLYTLLFGISNGIVSGALTYILSVVMKNNMSGLEFSAFMSIAFFYFCFVVGIQFPVFLKFGFTRFYMITSLPMYLIFVGGLALSQKIDINSINQTIQYFTNNPAMVWVIGIGAGLLLACISCTISLAISKRHEL